MLGLGGAKKTEMLKKYLFFKAFFGACRFLTIDVGFVLTSYVVVLFLLKRVHANGLIHPQVES